jgi:uncharacterized short protein YbdD (DUF466 family)
LSGRLRVFFKTLAGIVRRLSDQDGYAIYLHHWRTHHAGEGQPLSPAAWFRAEQDRRWNGGPRRCC